MKHRKIMHCVRPKIATSNQIVNNMYNNILISSPVGMMSNALCHGTGKALPIFTVMRVTGQGVSSGQHTGGGGGGGGSRLLQCSAGRGSQGIRRCGRKGGGERRRGQGGDI